MAWAFGVQHAAPLPDRAADRLVGLFVDFAVFHYEGDVLDGVDFIERVVGCGYDVGVFAGLDTAENFRFAEQVGGAARRGLDRLHRRHAVLHHKRELIDAAVVGADASVGAERKFHAGVERLGEIAAMRLA